MHQPSKLNISLPYNTKKYVKNLVTQMTHNDVFNENVYGSNQPSLSKPFMYLPFFLNKKIFMCDCDNEIMAHKVTNPSSHSLHVDKALKSVFFVLLRLLLKCIFSR